MKIRKEETKMEFCVPLFDSDDDEDGGIDELDPEDLLKLGDEDAGPLPDT